jgi:hypothetical protein
MKPASGNLVEQDVAAAQAATSVSLGRQSPEMTITRSALSNR